MLRIPHCLEYIYIYTRTDAQTLCTCLYKYTVSVYTLNKNIALTFSHFPRLSVTLHILLAYLLPRLYCTLKTSALCDRRTLCIVCLSSPYLTFISRKSFTALPSQFSPNLHTLLLASGLLLNCLLACFVLCILLIRQNHFHLFLQYLRGHAVA
jgi:hypothetical protein